MSHTAAAHRVRFNDLGAATEMLRAGIDAAVARVLNSGRYVLGEEVESFERRWAEYCGVTHCVGVGNGLDALVLALAAAGIGAGDEVLVPSHTFVATWMAVARVGATPVAVEPDPRTANVPADAWSAHVGPHTRAIVHVHLYGLPTDLAALRTLAAERDLFVLEDAAQAHGARVAGRRCGALGHAAAFSFYPTKNLGALGDAGAVVTDSPELADRVRVLRSYGATGPLTYGAVGLNSRLDPLQAAVLGVKLDHLDAWNERRRALAARYDEGLAGAPAALRLPAAAPSNGQHSYHQYVIQHPARDALRRSLDAAGVGTLVHYPVPCHRASVFAGLVDEGALPEADRLAAEILSLPMGPHLGDDDIERVVEAVLDCERRC